MKEGKSDHWLNVNNQNVDSIKETGKRVMIILLLPSLVRNMVMRHLFCIVVLKSETISRQGLEMNK